MLVGDSAMYSHFSFPHQVIRATAVEMKLTPDDDFVLRVVQLSELLAIRHCVFLMGPTGCGRSECYRVSGAHARLRVGMATAWPTMVNTSQCVAATHTTHALCTQVLARAIAKGTSEPVNDYLKMTNKKKVTIRDIDPKSVSTQELYGFVNMATREWKVGGGFAARGGEVASARMVMASRHARSAL